MGAQLREKDMNNHTGQIQDIISLCIQLTEAKNGHFHFNYHGKVQMLDVSACTMDCTYKQGEFKYIEGLGAGQWQIWLKEPEASEQLEALIKKLEGMLWVYLIVHMM